MEVNCRATRVERSHEESSDEVSKDEQTANTIPKCLPYVTGVQLRGTRDWVQRLGPAMLRSSPPTGKQT